VADFDWDHLSLSLENPTVRSFKQEQFDRLRLQRGDILLEKSGGGERTPVGRVVRFDDEVPAITSNFVARMRPASCTDSRYLTYLFASLYQSRFSHQFIKQNTGIQNLDDSALLDTSVWIPDVPTQKAIADFLDRETARIDQLIEKKQRLVELLEERESAYLESAVTGRSSPSRLFRDAGVKWIGQVPVEWTVPKFTHVARLESGHTPSRNVEEYWLPEDCTIPWFSLSDIWQVRQMGRVYVSDTCEKISPIGMANSAARLLPKDTVILSRTASVGFPAILAIPMATTQDFVNWVCGPMIRPKYLYYVLRAMRRDFRRLMMGSTHQTIYMPDVKSFRTPLPTIDEQDMIAGMLDHSLSTFASISQRTKSSVERLHELRSALITAAVTGQIDVADWSRRGETERRLEFVEHKLEEATV
jgi:type I restriction enzyme S subunit